MWEINVRENQRTIENEQSGDTANTEYTRHRTTTNKTNKLLEKTKEQSRMNSPEKLTTLNTQDTGRRQTQ